MATITVFGYSDDLLEIVGDFSLEANCYNAPPIPVIVNGQHMLTATYTRRGLWKITTADLPEGFTAVMAATAKSSSGYSPRHEAPHEDKPSYSDVLTLTGPIETVTAHGETGYQPRKTTAVTV